MLDLKDIEKNYEKMPDDEIVRIATTNATGLRPEVYGIIENEIKKRNLSPDLLNGINAQNKKYTIDEIETYSELLRGLPCPICGNTHKKLNGTTLHTVRSFILLTTYKAKPVVACPDCLDKKNKDAIISTALLGWWGVPWGILKTPVYIYRNIKAKKQHRSPTPNNTILAFTLGNIGEIEAYKNDIEMLKEIIGRRNN